jgi:type I restriction enzyme S subunit
MDGLAIKRLTLAKINHLLVPIPPLGEQRKIAAILSSVDDAIEATQAVIEQLQVVKKAMMAELLTRGLPGRHTRFKMTDIGEVPEEWEVGTLSDVLVDGPTNGLYKPASQIGRGALVAGMTAIEGSSLNWRLCRRAELTESEVARFGLRPRDLLVTRVYARVDGIGRFILVPEVTVPVGYESNMMRLRVATERVLPEFVAAHMTLPDVRREIEQRATLGAQASINNEGVRSLALRLPPLEEQEEISAALKAVGRRIESERMAQEQLKDVKAALMSVLLTGEVRVKPDEEAA